MRRSEIILRIDNLYQCYLSNKIDHQESKALAKDICEYMSRDVEQTCTLYLTGHSLLIGDTDKIHNSALSRKVLQTIKISITNQLFDLFDINPTITTIKKVMNKIFEKSINHDTLMKSFAINNENTAKNKISKENLIKIFSPFDVKNKTDDDVYNYLLTELRNLWKLVKDKIILTNKRIM